MNKRRILILVLAVIFAVSLIVVACKKDEEPKHEHLYGTKWSYDETHHWHRALCEHRELSADKAAHNVVNNKCTVCEWIGEGFSWVSASSSGETSGAKVLPEPPAKADKPSVQIHYYRANSADYKTWSLWLWSKVANNPDAKNGNVQSTDAAPNYGWPIQYQDDDGGVAIYTLDELGWKSSQDVLLGFIPRLMDGSWTKDAYGADRFWNLSEAEMDSNNYYHLYIVTGIEQVFEDVEDYRAAVLSLSFGLNAHFIDESRLVVTAASPVKSVELFEDGETLADVEFSGAKEIYYRFEDGKKMDFSKDYTVSATFTDQEETVKTANVSIDQLYNSESFEETYYYDGELGALYTQDETEFRVWSPVSQRIVLKLYEQGNGGEAYQTVEMTKGDKGVFSAKVSGDLAEKYYTYTVYNASYNGKEIVDPYAKSAGLNGVRGQIVDFDTINSGIDGWNNVTAHPYHANELTVWETHVADVTSSATWTGTEAYRNKFLGMIEQGTTYTKDSVTVSTGFDHIKELGVNAVQLVPIFDQAGNNEADMAFNWGYNPLNYNVLEGGYSTNPSDGYNRIIEFKQLVKAFNAEGINVIMDVVYNHVSAALGSNFDVLMPGYYYRYDMLGGLSNGSGCGNETASERSMFRKFMIDSVCFWAGEYKLGGFRFDLMGLHDLDTMNELTAELKKINPSIIVYGEPWTGGSTTLPSSQMANQANGDKYVGYGQFNDEMRDALIKGGLNGASQKGWATGGDESASAILNGLQGFTRSNIHDLFKTVNYVTCHDNYTLYDRVMATGQTNEATIRKMAMLANSVVFTSNGVNFMLAGEEFLRSKAAGGAVGEQVHNSYNASYKVNELDYALKIKNKDIFDNYVKLIAFKQTFKDMGLTSNETVASKYSASANGNLIEITISAGNTTWKIVHANGAGSADLAGYTVYLDTLKVNAENASLSANTSIQAYQTIIAKKGA